MKCAIKIGSGAMICMPNFMKIDSDTQKLEGIHRQQGDLISLLLFFSK
jgi:hypothetical protein